MYMDKINHVENVKAMQRAIAENVGNYSTVLERYDTGSYKYVLTAHYNAGTGMYFNVIKTDKNERILGKVVIFNYSLDSCEYDETIFKVPNSLIKHLLQFVRAVKLLKYK